MTLSDLLTRLTAVQKAYNKQCESVLIKYNMQKTAFDILMFLANNKQYYTANAISEVRNIKPNVVSLHVEKLVNEGYIARQAVEGDRRKVKLVCTDKAKPIIEDGQIVQKDYIDKLLYGLSKDELSQFKAYFEIIANNANKMI